MPIVLNFDAIARQFEAPIQALSIDIAAAVARFARWLSARLRSAVAMEGATQSFPTIQFSGAALNAWVDASQHGTLHAAGGSIGGGLVSGGRHFVQGLGRTFEAAQEELILPRTLSALRRGFDAIVASVDRFAIPTTDMFDPSRRTASDLFGLFGLLAAATLDSRRQVTTLIYDQMVPLVRLLRPPATSAGRTGVGLPEMLDRAVHYILMAVLLLPAIPALLRVWGRAAGVILRTMLLDKFQELEGELFSMRTAIIDVLTRDLPDFLVSAVGLLSSTWSMVGPAMVAGMRFGLAYVGQLLTSVRGFTQTLFDFMNPWITLLNRVLAVIEAVMNFDLMPFIAAPLGPFAGILPRLTLGELLDAGANAVRATLRNQLLAWVTAVRIALAVPGAIVDLSDVEHKLDLIAEIIAALFQAPKPYPDETDTSLALPPPLPNLYTTMIGAQLPALRTRLTGAVTGIVASVGGILVAGSDLLLGMSVSFARAGDRASRTPSADLARGIAGRADLLADLAFGPQLAELRGAPRHESDLAGAFERWVLRGGFVVIGEVLPLYVREMTDWWARQVDQGSELLAEVTPTSAHILAAHARVGRVRMEHLLIRAHRRPTDEGLVEEVAGRIREAVEAAYVAGTRQLAGAR